MYYINKHIYIYIYMYIYIYIYSFNGPIWDPDGVPYGVHLGPIRAAMGGINCSTYRLHFQGLRRTVVQSKNLGIAFPSRFESGSSLAI